MTTLLNNVNADTTSAVFLFNGGSGTLFIRGDDFGGGTVALEVATTDDSFDRFIPLPNGVFTEGTTKTLDYLSHSTQFRAVLSGATDPVNIFVSITQ